MGGTDRRLAVRRKRVERAPLPFSGLGGTVLRRSCLLRGPSCHSSACLRALGSCSLRRLLFYFLLDDPGFRALEALPYAVLPVPGLVLALSCGG